VQGPLRKFFKDLGLELEFSPIEQVDLYLFPDFSFQLTSNFQNLKESLCKMFPNEMENIELYFNIIRNLFKKINSDLSEYLDKDYFFFLDSIFKDEKLKAVLSARTFCSTINTVTMLVYLRKIIFGGLYQNNCKRNLSQILKDKFIEKNGVILYNHSVDRFLIENNSIKGVLCENGNLLEANFYVSACDMKNVFLSKLGIKLPKDITQTLEHKKTTLSVIMVYMIVKKLPDIAREYRASKLYIFQDYNIKKIYKDKEEGILDAENGIKINIVDLFDEDFKNRDYFKIRIEYEIGYVITNTKLSKREITEKLISTVSSKIGINREDIVDYKVMFPEDFKLMVNTTNGAVSGWAPDDLFDPSKFEDSVALNFCQTGCWDKYGSGILPIYYSALRAVNKIKKFK
jgi:phytoene dehydrogenase-like protein